MSTADMVKVGRQIMEGKGFCLTCHTIGKTGALRFPDLAGVDVRAMTRVPGLNDVEYFAESMYEPTAYVVAGFPPAMPPINKPPIGLTDQEILCVIAYLQSLGGTPTVTLQTTHHYSPGAAPGGAPAAAPAAGAAPAPGAVPAGAPAAAPAAAPAPGGAQPPAAPAAPSRGAELRTPASSPHAGTVATAGQPDVLHSLLSAVVFLRPVVAHQTEGRLVGAMTR